MEFKHKTMVLTFTEYHDEIEATDKRITIEVQTAYHPGLAAIDEDALIKERMLNQLKLKLGL